MLYLKILYLIYKIWSVDNICVKYKNKPIILDNILKVFVNNGLRYLKLSKSIINSNNYKSTKYVTFYVSFNNGIIEQL